MKDSGTRDVLGILIHPVENTEELKRTGNYEVESLPVEEEVDANAPANR